jgi:hypothetical protein
VVSTVGFLLNLSFPAETRHIVALRDVIVQAVRQAGGEEDHARDFAEQAAELIRESADQQQGSGTLKVVVELGPPIQVIVGGRTLTLQAS